MPAVMEPPSVALSFANNFWGKDDAGVTPMLERMAAAKTTNDELRSFYAARAAIEEDYAKKLLALCKKSLGSQEMGTLKHSLDTVRGEVESMGKQHASIAAQMKTELEEPLGAFAGGMKERRKIVQNTVEKLLKIKVGQTNTVNKTRDRYEQDCLKIKGYLAQGHMVMGQEERKNKAKLEKTQISVATTNSEYEAAVKALEDTTVRWNREWKAAADKFQDLEEERLDFTKSSLWTFANVASTVCVSDDASCEKIRVSLEKMDVEKDILHFITEKGTSQEIPDAPKYINFCRGDVDDHVSEASDDDAYSVAQFPRSINPAFRSSSPQPSTFESHHDPNSALAREMGREMGHQEVVTPTSREATATPQKTASAQIMPLRDSRQGSNGLQQYASREDTRHGGHPLQQYNSRESREEARQGGHPLQQFNSRDSRDDSRHGGQALQQYNSRESREEVRQGGYALQQYSSRDSREEPRQERYGMPQQYNSVADPRQSHDSQYGRRQPQAPQNLDAPSQNYNSRQPPQVQAQAPVQQQQQQQRQQQQQQSYDTAEFAAVPHDPYPMDGMTMLCRTDGMNSATSSNLSGRPSSRDDNSDYSNPTSMSSVEPAPSPVKQQEPEPTPIPAAEPEKRMLKKKSGFFQNHSPFRRKSVKDLQAAAANPNRNTWGPTTVKSPVTPVEPRRPQIAQTNSTPRSVVADRNVVANRSPTPDPIDANASLALNIGQNVFSVSNTDKRSKQNDAETPAAEEMDPIALALAELKGVTSGKQSSGRISADHYHGIATPAPPENAERARPFSRSVPAPRAESVASSTKVTSPPSYETQISRLGVPPPAVTSRAMKEASRKYTEQTQTMFTRPATTSYTATPTRPATRQADVPRAASPAPLRTQTQSPRPGMHPDTRQAPRSASPNPTPSTYQRSVPRPVSPNPAPSIHQRTVPRAASPNPAPSIHQRTAPRAASPNPMPSVQQRAPPRAASPNPMPTGHQRAPSSMSQRSQRPQPQARAPEPSYARQNSNSDFRSASPAASFRGSWNSRPASRASHMSRNDMAVQLSPIGPDAFGSSAGSEYGGSVRGRGAGTRPGTSHSNRGAMGLYDGRDPAQEGSRQRSKSVADPSRQYTPEGRPILHYARALYLYQAAIPEELGFAKGDTLAVLRHQDDGWWEAEIHSGANQGRNGLVPSNYLQPL